MRRVPSLIAILILIPLALLAAGDAVTFPNPPAAPKAFARRESPAPRRESGAVLEKNLLLTWYGNPWSERMGILGRLEGSALAEGLKRQAAGYAAVTKKSICWRTNW